LPFSSEQLLSKQLKLNGESAKNIMTNFAFPYVSYLLYGLQRREGGWKKVMRAKEGRSNYREGKEEGSE